MEFQKGWYGTDLGEYRPHIEEYATYTLFSYDELPQITKKFVGDFSWLKSLDGNVADQMDIHYPSDNNFKEMQKTLKKLISAAAKLKVKLPQEFITFLESKDLQRSIPSATACYFSLSESIIISPFEDNAFMIRFFNDQQDCVLWYLYLTPAGNHQILCSPIFFDDLEKRSDEIFYSRTYNEEIKKEVLYNNTFFCAPTFEEFLYRYWLENTIWFSIDGGSDFTEEEEKYLKFYNR